MLARTALKVNTEKRQGKTMRPKVVKIAPLENTGTGRGRRHQALARHVRGESLELCGTSIQMKPWRAHILPRPALRDTIVWGQGVKRVRALLENMGTERGRRHQVLARTAIPEQLLHVRVCPIALCVQRVASALIQCRDSCALPESMETCKAP